MHMPRKPNRYAEPGNGIQPNDEVYGRWADQLDALPNGFPRTESGIEIRLLKKIAHPDEAWLLGQLCRKLDSAEGIGARVGLSSEEVKQRLDAMLPRGVVGVEEKDGVDHYQLMPFMVGFYEAHRDRLDHEFTHLFEQYMMLQGARGIFGVDPPIFRVIPSQETVKSESILPYDDVRAILLEAKSFELIDCVCRHEQDVNKSRRCDFPLQVCLSFSKEEGAAGPHSISRERALAILEESEELGLVHCVENNVEDVDFVCNCCGCCCGILRGITDWGIENSVAKANYYVEIDPDECQGCQTCIDRCQVNAISIDDEELAVVDTPRCIGCGLCVSGCPEEAAILHRLPDSDLTHPPEDLESWGDERLRNRGLME